MREMSRRDVMAAGTVALAATALPAWAARGGYRLLVENNVDTLCVGRLASTRLGPPASTATLSIALLRDPAALATVADSMAGRRTVVVASPAIVTALGALARGARRSAPALAEDIRRILPADRVEVAIFA